MNKQFINQESSSEDEALSESKENDTIAFNQIIDTSDFYCPISCKLMHNPVMLFCGHNFEESKIQDWFSKRKERICPVCNQTSPNDPATNLFLKNVIAKWREKAQLKDEEDLKAGPNVENQKAINESGINSNQISSTSIAPFKINKSGVTFNHFSSFRPITMPQTSMPGNEPKNLQPNTTHTRAIPPFSINPEFTASDSFRWYRPKVILPPMAYRIVTSDSINTTDPTPSSTNRQGMSVISKPSQTQYDDLDLKRKRDAREDNEDSDE
jgi:hypothetical protein